MWKRLLFLIFVTAQAGAQVFTGIERAPSPDKRFSVALDNHTDRIYLEDAKTGQEIGLVEAESVSEKVIVRWSPDGSKVAIEVEHRRWNETFILVRANHDFRKVEFTPPDVFAMYHAHPPRNPPPGSKTITNDDAVGQWLNNSEITMVAAYGLSATEPPDGSTYTIKAAYVLQITHGRARVKGAKLKVMRWK